MSGASSIEWTDATWSPVVGCTRVSAGCDHCYAAKMTRRLEAMGQEKYKGLSGRGHFNGVARLHAPSLDWPLRWRGAKTAKAEGRPSRIFVNPMSDLFHERLSDEEIAAVFGVMAACPQHVFQVLTKRPERARKWFTDGQPKTCSQIDGCLNAASYLLRPYGARYSEPLPRALREWPLPNVWLGTSVENQATADERIPLLLQCPSAVRFVSYEPALGAVDFERWLGGDCEHCQSCGEAYRAVWSTDDKTWLRVVGRDGGLRCPDCFRFEAAEKRIPDNVTIYGEVAALDWLIVGGESGPGARPCHVDWIRSVRDQCKAAGVACFIKQAGRRVFGDPEGFRVDRYILDGGALEWQPPIIGFDKARFRRDNADRICGFKLFDRKGGDWSEWPSDLKVREFPR